MKKWLLVILGLIIIGAVLLVLRGNEDTWIKDNRGVWVKHGSPGNTPPAVLEQQDLINKTQKLFQTKIAQGQDISKGPCLGSIAPDWVADIAHNPRQSIDDESQNQCADFLSGKAHHFIEIDPNDEIIKIK